MLLGRITAACLLLATPASAERILVFSKTAGFRHASIPDGVRAVKEIGAANGIDVDATEDAGVFTDANLGQYDGVVFLNTTGDVLNPAQEAAFERFIRDGKGFVGIHSATDTEYEWPWYQALVGAAFGSHPRVQKADIIVEDRTHPSTRHLPPRWQRVDEWYDFRASPTGRVHVLMRLDESTYEGGRMGQDHPVAWCHEYDGGRAWYTAGGHTSEAFLEPDFRQHIAGGLAWVLGREDAAVSATIDRYYDVVTLDDEVTDPMELAIARDGRVFFVERAGVVKVWKPDTKRTVTAGFLDVFDELEDGLLGIALDPDFDRNGWIYLYYSPRGAEPENVLARFTVVGDQIDAESEVVMLRIPTQRDECCHSGGSITFDQQGNLYLSTGDNTSPFASDGYAPIDERPGRMPFDAQKSSANTRDLRGKILRITPQPDGTYRIPSGNLFTDEERGRPEIYIMGCRNPFRIAIDPKTGALCWGDVGPDAGAPRAGRGPAGYDEVNRATGPGNYGWPYVIADNRPYTDYDFATNESAAAPYDVSAPVNESPNGTGAINLPPAQPAWIWYGYDPSAEFPWIGDGERCAMGGPTYRPALLPGPRSPHALPDAFDGKLFLYEWSRDWIKAITVGEDGSVARVEPFLSTETLRRPMDLEIGPDGRMYLIEWGTGFGGANRNSAIRRIDYYQDGRLPPLAQLDAQPTSGPVGLEVAFSAAGSENRSHSGTLSYAWDFDGNGTVDARGPGATHRYPTAGDYVATLTVSGGYGLATTRTVRITVGNTAPGVRIDWPPNGAVAGFGDEIDYVVSASDPEDGPAIRERVEVQTALGHDTHAHPLERYDGHSGSFHTLRDAGHEPDADLFSVLAASVTDDGGRGVSRLTGRDEVILQPRRKQAEHAAEIDEVRIEKTSDTEGGGSCAVFERDGAAIAIDPMHFAGIDAIRARIATGGAGGTLELRAQSRDGELLGTIDATGDAGVALSKGPQQIRIEYFESGGGAGLILRMTGGGMKREVVPAPLFGDGLSYAFYDLDGATFHGSLDRIPDFTHLEPYAIVKRPDINIPSTNGPFADSGRSERVGAIITGTIDLPADGRYEFHLESDDGSRLYVNDELIVDNDGTHAMIERSSAAGWREVTTDVVRPDDTFRLWLVFRAASEGATLRLNWVEFAGPAATGSAPAALR